LDRPKPLLLYLYDVPNGLRNEPVTLDEDKIREGAEKCIARDIREEALKNPGRYEDTEKTTNFSIDRRFHSDMRPFFFAIPTPFLSPNWPIDSCIA
jgi:hypothetical protein